MSIVSPLLFRDFPQVNGRELLTLAGVPLPQGSDNDDACDFATVVKAATSLAASLGGPDALECVCWTDGPFPGGALDVQSGRAWKLTLPPLPGPVLSPVGAGDAVAGGTFHAWLGLHSAAGSTSERTGPSGVAAFQFGLACGAASCLTAENSALDLTIALGLHAKIIAEEYVVG
jgi:sugar/nucleoside kinase (ribokinase family)